ncbi:MAG: acyltransferase domain-containing protein [Actinobacteria bacterium]|nr:acyltransferase domain-containing protein [Actinomycetota bacterium]
MSTFGASSAEALPPNAIAVVGMAGRFPGANSVTEFWDNLRRGEESIVTLSEGQLSAEGIGADTLANPSYVKRAPLLEGYDEFDADYFGFPPQAARMLDPQQRQFLQCAWHALEDSGYDPATYDGAIGVFGCSSVSTYLLGNILSHHDPNVMGQGASFELLNLFLQNDKDYVATRVCHQFNLRGPGITVQTACSSSLVAVHLACQSLLTGECDMVLAGGVTLRVPHHAGYWHDPGTMVSPAGRCRPFDVRADGTIFGSGVGIVVLKTLQAAIDDGDRIHAVIRGSAINNDGAMKMNFAAPNPAAQAEVIAEAHAVADVDASTITYVETHGTATPLGDPIEIDGLRKAFSVSTQPRSAPCTLGSVKSNIGHLEVASGITGLIKTILCLKHRAIPATLHFTRPNPALNLESSPFVVQSEYGPWHSDGVRRAGVSSFGVGGTNAHVVVEEAPAAPVSPAAAGPQVLLMSARTAEGLQTARAELAAALTGPDALDLADVAYTLAGRRKERVRLAAVVDDHEHAATVLRSAETENVVVGEYPDGGEDAPQAAFLFPGQGAQHAGMAKGLYQSEPVFAQHFDQCVDGFSATMGIDLRAEVFDSTGSHLERTDLAQPALFAVEYALAKLTESYGVVPVALAGHSIGEYAAATLAGVFDLESAIKAVSVRARLMHEAPAGVMVAVALGPDAIAEHLSADVDLAAVNDPANCVIAGSAQSIRAFQSRLAEHGIAARRIRTSHAFHSSAMDPVLDEFTAFLSGLTLRAPRTPLLSNVTGTWMSDAQATDPATWARQIRATVRFADELDALLGEPHRALVEVGPGSTLTASAVRHPRFAPTHHTVRLMRHQAQHRGDREAFLLGLGQLWSAGVPVDWSPLAGQHQPQRVTLPGYPFARQRHWIERRTIEWSDQPASGTNGHAAATTADTARQAAGGETQLESTLLTICAQCLGVAAIGRDDNFFELGGDSLIAVGVAMSANKQGLELKPQDLYEHQTVAALAGMLSARYAEGGLTEPAAAELLSPPATPSLTHFLEYGLGDPGRWRVPVILELAAEVTEDDVRAVLAAVSDHHDALRLRMVDPAGTWELRIDPPGEFDGLATRSLPGDPGDPSQWQAVLDIVTEQIRSQDLSGPALTAVHVTDSTGVSRYLAVTVHEAVVDVASREILLTDLFTAFGQRLAGEEILLPPPSATWAQWAQRCTAMAAHPAVLERQDYWRGNATAATLRLSDGAVNDPPRPDDLVRLSSTLTTAQTADVDRARRRFGHAMEEVLLAALGRVVAGAVGEGVLTVDLTADARPVFKPDVDVRRTVGGFTTLYPVPLDCADPAHRDAGEAITAVRTTLDEVPHRGIGYGLLRYVYAPTARRFGAVPLADILINHVGTIPDFPAGDGPVRLDADALLPVRDTIPGLGHAVELRVYRAAEVLHADWWYDTRRIGQATVEAMVERFPAVLTDLMADAMAAAQAEDEPAPAAQGLALVDLSAE